MNQLPTTYKVLFSLALICLVAIPVLWITGSISVLGIVVPLMFLFLAMGVRAIPSLMGFSFTLWVFSGVSFALFYPMEVLNVGGFSTTVLIVPLIQIIMFGMGTSMSLQDFAGVIKMPKGVLVGIVCQYSIMPILGITLALTFGLPAEIAAGVVLIGSSPGGVASNVMAYLAKGNVALSITLTAVSTLLAPVLTPLLMQVFAGQFVPIEFYSMMMSILNMIILPVAAGLIFNRIFYGKVQWLHNWMPALSMAAIVIILAIMSAAGQEYILVMGVALFVVAVLHNGAGYLLGYWGCRLVGLEESDCRTVALEVGMQNAGMAAGIATEMGRAATMGVAPTVFGTWMNVTGSVLANWWRDKTGGEPDPVDDTEPVEQQAAEALQDRPDTN